MQLFDTILEGHTSNSEIDSHCQMLSYGETESTEQVEPLHSQFFNTYHGIDVYYDYGADYYYFEDTIH